MYYKPRCNSTQFVIYYKLRNYYKLQRNIAHIRRLHLVLREKEGDLTQSYDKNPYTNRKFENQRTTHTNATKNFDYTTIVDRKVCTIVT